jgi:hypothetical protein
MKGATLMSRKARKPEKPDEPSHIIGVAAHGVHVEGSKLFPCAQCGLPVWMSPASQRLLATGEWLPSCEKCGYAAIDAGADLQGLAPGALEELHAWLNRN